MPQNPDQKSFEAPDLPRFSDRLPDLVHILGITGSSLLRAKTTQSYLPYWEDIYAIAHSLKGVSQILLCDQRLQQFIFRFCDFLSDGLTEKSICRKVHEAGSRFSSLSEILDKEQLHDINFETLNSTMDELNALYDQDLNHEQRLAEIPRHLFYVNEFVSKKAREISLLHLNHCSVEEEILLDEVALWRTQLNEALQAEDFGRGMIVNFLPFLSPEGSRQLKVWAWVAAATHSRAALKQRLKEFMPKISIGKI